MGPRSRKIVAATTVLLLGVAAAWPLRLRRTALRSHGPASALAGQTHLLAPAWTASAGAVELASGAPVRAREVSSSARPAVAGQAEYGPRGRLTTDDAGGIGRVLDPLAASLSNERSQRIHIVHEGDRLDRLAKRYLGDESRALELFDLNREVLTNPHLLPIGTELHIPPGEKTSR